MPEFNFVETQDGSLSLRLGLPSDGPESATTESMHSLRGAFSETVYIYGTAMELCFSRHSQTQTQTAEGFSPRVMSLGLGLGYVEILAAALSLKLQCPLEGESFELVPELRDWFKSWLEDSASTPADFQRAYDDVLRRTAEHAKLDAKMIKARLQSAVRDGQWQIREALDHRTQFSKRFGCICFDAFSSKTTPELWSEEFLRKFLEQACEPKCVLSTYACTGALKRSLRDAGFELNIREGFSSKRDSTFAVRG